MRSVRGGSVARFTFNRKGDIDDNPVGAQVTFTREGRHYIGDVRGYYRDEDGTPRLRVSWFNGEPWPIDPPAALVWVLERTYSEGESDGSVAT